MENTFGEGKYPQKKSVSIVIPNYNGQLLLATYLPFTLNAIKNTGVAYEIIVVDDCSTDTSVQYLKQHYPEILVIENLKNSGFGFSCNEGIRMAKMNLILLLNSDVKLSPNYFDQLWQYFSSSNTFGVMGRINHMDTSVTQEAARMPKKSGFKIKTDHFYHRLDDGKTLTLYLSGANALIDADKLKTIEGFELLFSPFYGEDFELSLRAWRLNWNCYYEHEAICEHQISASTKNFKTARWVKMIYFRNRYYLHALHLNGIELILWFLQITLIDLLIKIVSGKFWIAESYFEFLKHFKRINKAKQAFKLKMIAHGSNTSLNDVIRKIRSSAGERDIKPLKVGL